jgi:hypothetical protein
MLLNSGIAGWIPVFYSFVGIQGVGLNVTRGDG